jgi:hypothetical protein
MYRNSNVAAEVSVAVKTMIRMNAVAVVNAIASKRFLSLGF